MLVIAKIDLLKIKLKLNLIYLMYFRKNDKKQTEIFLYNKLRFLILLCNINNLIFQIILWKDNFIMYVIHYVIVYNIW